MSDKPIHGPYDGPDGPVAYLDGRGIDPSPFFTTSHQNPIRHPIQNPVKYHKQSQKAIKIPSKSRKIPFKSHSKSHSPIQSPIMKVIPIESHPGIFSTAFSSPARCYVCPIKSLGNRRSWWRTVDWIWCGAPRSCSFPIWWIRFVNFLGNWNMS